MKHDMPLTENQQRYTSQQADAARKITEFLCQCEQRAKYRRCNLLLADHFKVAMSCHRVTHADCILHFSASPPPPLGDFKVTYFFMSGAVRESASKFLTHTHTQQISQKMI